MQKLQQEAVQRVQEMQSRARRHLEESPQDPPPDEAAQPKQAELPSVPEKQPELPMGNLFDGLLADKERSLILMLALLLYEEQADMSVVFGLLYLIL